MGCASNILITKKVLSFQHFFLIFAQTIKTKLNPVFPMKNFTKFLSLLFIAAITFVSCDTKDNITDTPTDRPEITLAESEVIAEADGGNYSVEYTILNAVEGATLTVKEDAEWISDVTVVADKITFVVAANEEGVERAATLLVEYTDAEPQSISVKQSAAEVPVSDIRIDVQEVHASSAITQVTPDDNDMYYIMYLEEVSYFQYGGIETAEQLMEDDFSAFKRSAANNDMNLKAYMEAAKVLFKGTQRVQWSNVLPGVKSVLYVYGVQFNEDGSKYEAITDIAWELIVPEYAPLQDVVFNLDTDVNGAEVTLNIEPQNWDGYYLVKFVDYTNELYVHDESVFTDDYMKIIADEWIGVYDGNLDLGFTMEDILSNTCYKGNQSVDIELYSYTLYSALVYPIAEYDGFVQVVGKPSYINFSTEEVQESDMDIDIEVTNCYVRVADIRLTPSEPDTQYMMLITQTSYLPEDYDDDYLLDKIFGEWNYAAFTFKGEVTSHLNTLYPDTEYLIVAFGYSGGQVTTDICKKTFKTEPEGECQIEVTGVNIGGPYLPSELYAYDPERFKYYGEPYAYDFMMRIITMEVQTSEPTQDMFVHAFPQMDYDYAGHDIIFFDLLIGSCEPFEYTTIITDYMPYYICAAAFDYKGNVTPMWMSEPLDWTNVEPRPIEELIEKIDAYESGDTTSKFVLTSTRM